MGGLDTPPSLSGKREEALWQSPSRVVSRQDAADGGIMAEGRRTASWHSTWLLHRSDHTPCRSCTDRHTTGVVCARSLGSNGMPESGVAHAHMTGGRSRVNSLERNSRTAR